jgi:hypothetical protein
MESGVEVRLSGEDESLRGQDDNCSLARSRSMSSESSDACGPS